MTRLERAWLIVGRIETLAKQQGWWEQSDGGKSAHLHVDVGEGWTASMYSPLADAIATIGLSGCAVTVEIDEPSRIPVVVDVWVDGAKVLSAEHDAENFALRSMKPGSWEDCFLGVTPVHGHC